MKIVSIFDKKNLLNFFSKRNLVFEKKTWGRPERISLERQKFSQIWKKKQEPNHFRH